MKVQVLGTGCQRCDTLYRNAVEAVERIGGEEAVTVEKVTDQEVFFRLKVYVTPALVIDENVISTGKAISVEQIESEIRKYISGADK
ncbi:MAG: thioredoxin family protein [Desulfomonilaceae bacterium]|nr:thioredoxin family protein [Desulfomonilaceae bacterium]